MSTTKPDQMVEILGWETGIESYLKRQLNTIQIDGWQYYPCRAVQDGLSGR
jgi:hypothetical protein